MQETWLDGRTGRHVLGSPRPLSFPPSGAQRDVCRNGSWLASAPLVPQVFLKSGLRKEISRQLALQSESKAEPSEFDMREKHDTTTNAAASPEAEEPPDSLAENSSPLKKNQGNAADRDALLALVANEKMMSLIKAWEENERTKVENKTEKKMSSILSWENSKKAALEADLRKIQEKLEEKKAECAEKMKNKIATIHKEAEERRAMAEARWKVDLLKVEDRASEYRSTGHIPKIKKRFGCCSSIFRLFCKM